MHVVPLSGSLRSESSNAALLRAATRLFAPVHRVEAYEGLSALPHFNPDLDVDPAPAEVAALR